MAARWDHFEHEADFGVRGIAATLEQAFMQAALAMMAAVIVESARISASACVEITCQAPDTELLLVDWLNAHLYEMAARKRLFSRFEVKIVGDTLTGRAWGEAVDLEKHQPTVEIKGATYTALRVAQENGHWLARCVVDV
ncbi:archease [Candidatus Tenderia electrophaga]|jgi:tRNA nucleotidyltransferase (CCA-adding enzyme)|uniref:Archease n=1 Tax=Candidatus Tenderia electrophaga TaxID=1748243 RepID=A0A0S2T9T4_9GAMM|nr:archease [Candidatus Tenderia electrophaga]